MRLPRPWTFFLCVTLVVLAPATARAGGPAEVLLRLVPPDAGLTLSVEDLRGHLREVRKSPLAERVRTLPAFQAWLKSDELKGVQEAASRVEALLGEDVATVADDLFGDAAVLTLWLPRGEGLESARGLLLVRVPNRERLDKLVESLNTALKANGELQSVADRSYGGTTYHVREFRPGERLAEFYGTIQDEVFVWSNSEDLIRGAIDRRKGTLPGLSGLPAFRRVRDRLPDRSALSLFVDPRLVERSLAAAPRPDKTDDEIGLKLVLRYLGAMTYAGASLTWRDGLLLHVEESFDPAKVVPELKRPARPRPERSAALTRLVPKSALAVVSGSIDFDAAFALIHRLLGESGRSKLENFRVVFEGLFLGRDLRREILPALGPEVLVYAEPPDLDRPSGRLPATAVVAVADAKAGAAVANGLRTFLALYALDDKHDGGRLRVESRPVGASTVTTLGDTTPFAFAVDGARLILSTSTGGVVRALEARADGSSGSRFGAIRSAYFRDVETYLCIDLKAVHAFADAHRPELSRGLAARRNPPSKDATRELDGVLAIVSLLDAAFVTSAIEADGSGVHHVLGLVAAPRGVGEKP